MIGARIGRRKASAQKIEPGCRKIVANHAVEVCNFLINFSYLYILFSFVYLLINLSYVYILFSFVYLLINLSYVYILFSFVYLFWHRRSLSKDIYKSFA